jgi:hypothetical protein
MSEQNANASLILTAITSISLCMVPARAEEAAKWFVVRHTEIGSCSIEVLIRLQGAYRPGYGRIAGGPYDTEAAARERVVELERAGVCVPGS